MRNQREIQEVDVPSQIKDIAQRLRSHKRVNRRPLATLLSWFNATQRRAAVVANIQAALYSAGLETEPDFSRCNPDDSILFRFVRNREGGLSGSATTEIVPVVHNFLDTEETPPSLFPLGLDADESSDDFLEPESDDDTFVKDDDDPVVSVPADWTISALQEKWNDGWLDLQPSFQREYVWQLKPELPSRLIESILLEIPIPPLYFGKLSSGKLEVIDGQQRLTTLIGFVTNKFTLQRLTRMPSLNGSTFKDLSRKYQEKIKGTPIRTIQINAGTNTELRFEIFERLNRGSMALNEQELRNCVFRGKFNVSLETLEKDKEWRSVKGGDVPDPRFKEREIILRIFAFTNRLQFYKGGLKRFLNEYMAEHAPSSDFSIAKQSNMFKNTMRNIYTVFGGNSGRLYTIPTGSKEGRWDKKFSISALEIQASALFEQDHARVQKIADQIQEHYLLLILTNKAVQESISQATSGSAATRLRWTEFRSIIQPLIDNVKIEPRFFDVQIRKQIYDASPICAICGNRIHSLDDSVVDHILPYSRGGKTTRENGQLSHRSCNAIKNAAVPPELAIMATPERRRPKRRNKK